MKKKSSQKHTGRSKNQHNIVQLLKTDFKHKVKFSTLVKFVTLQLDIVVLYFSKLDWLWATQTVALMMTVAMSRKQILASCVLNEACNFQQRYYFGSSRKPSLVCYNSPEWRQLWRGLCDWRFRKNILPRSLSDVLQFTQKWLTSNKFFSIFRPSIC